VALLAQRNHLDWAPAGASIVHHLVDEATR
jgi:hypothetical protein